jgi:hypothetical protein
VAAERQGADEYANGYGKNGALAKEGSQEACFQSRDSRAIARTYM